MKLDFSNSQIIDLTRFYETDIKETDSAIFESNNIKIEQLNVQKNLGVMAIAEEAIRDVQKREGNDNLSGDEGEMGGTRRSGGIKTLGIGISAEFIQKGYINLRGKEIKKPKDLAVLAQVYRDPRFETLRFIYVKDNIIVGHEGITSKLPSSSVAFLNLPNRENYKNHHDYLDKLRKSHVKFFSTMLERMERLKADGYYILHNHPSAVSATPSKEDINVTAVYKNALWGFKGHVIINSNQYSFINRDLTFTEHTLKLGLDKINQPSLPNPMLGSLISNPADLAILAKKIQIDPNHSIVLYVNAKNKIRAIQEIPDGIFNNEKESVNFLRGRMNEFGASTAFVVTENEMVKEKTLKLVEKGYLLDVIMTSKDYESITSVRESGISPDEDSESNWMGLNVNRGMKVREKEEKYKPERERIGSGEGKERKKSLDLEM